MGISKERFGTMPGGREVYKYTLNNKNGVSASFITLGGVWVSMMAPDKNGVMGDVVLGYDDLDSYRKNTPHFGAPVGRNANRIGGAVLTINGRDYKLEANNGPNNLHSGPDLYHDRVWECEASETEKGSRLEFSLESPDGDQGYPGNARITVGYTLTDDNSLVLDYHMVCDADTIANFTNHSYFNLAGHDSGDVLKQEVWLNAEYYTPADAGSIPTGEIAPVAGTPMDFTVMKPIGRDIGNDFEALVLGKGYDHNWALNHRAGELSLAAKAMDPASGRVMEVYTDLPGIQFYTANFLTDEMPGKGGARYDCRHGFCFETQYYPDAVHKPEFPSPLLKAGEEYRTTTIYKFMTEQT
ncbi:MAG: galactose mutarotase [Clostridium sp.]|nr:galactose mutarotase [Clostridium sp.]